MQQPPELNPDPLAGFVAELSKRLDSIERRLDRIETYQREDMAGLRQEMRQESGGLRQEMAALSRRIDWVIGIGITAFVAVTGLLVTILLKLP